MLIRKKRVKGTETRSFGVGKREQHDSSKFYNSNLYNNININEKIIEVENIIDQKYIDSLICKDSRNMDFLPDSCIHLMVTSPPYNVSKDYDEDLSLEEYKELLRGVFSETHRVLVSGGRACINIANVGRKPYIPYHKYIMDIMDEIGFIMRGEIIWNKSASAGVSTAWGSWKSASNPVLRDVHEYILIYSKEKLGRKRKGKNDSINKEQFLEYTKSIWSFPAASAKKVGHPAPFPVDLPYRCIQLYTFEEEFVLDPFCGVGTTNIAAIKSNRHHIGIDIDADYIEKARKRIEEYLLQQSQTSLSFFAPKL
ncbi:site-specific DNA-methyltransferase [bacterium]|nr:site-specific DNA-methyltransferase [bacterium]